MHIAELDIPGVFVVTPELRKDERGSFFEGMRADEFESATGRRFVPLQINYSVSQNNTLRGIHSVTSPPGQAKYVTCVRGRLRDFVVDLRPGSPTFGKSASNVLDPESGRSVFVPEGVGHGFLSLADDSCISYVLSSVYVPGTQIDIDPLDPDLALPWGWTTPPLMSQKDANAMSLRQAEAAGLLLPYHAPAARISA
ncbi:dTDP-4-dehydrorhamnose 3,5-epimerase family protein [Streptomyces sp. NBC_00237]|uniref:dTDP-4-dehydrorhamnose 3,5-epimerase family protein n=1 Tax=Streptomyces sp. NBC_00237 TaxID=2975687 RepID=UPI002252DE4B|nr:dTDP-4-dehydrorhamnose 3,5-epimerase family protein [Streptomyces sp. NBC_00237]MCX5203225.1 dTDP-4-dehydrorhamnose 3,5-epimerase family protein [Streptomyces sp. NBC_00237]